ncbi:MULTISPECIES: phosphate/phosphite/phosphonate ABC transporter substrate-binding protein [unclassified Variovorax]|uniref:phosphate/phosphite/phosphonate ABC transporter substrate-binding protein n=1 Tax=unclassified Variovorax TaxID=663243 RepID=UPI0025777D75|nr:MULTISPECIES: phosphate/phosphite/phosphonate ABC transporter substrate-binding protein [unclassified Variovorax]MDM0087155.1 phosphate/phosphite/phosphonate ABC transporter substrate-binding protein [Variovorax sp. J22G40]MDM0144588.1 phosphate/phosphite/phosphonate ABC transporter substrate-binding protein [Variovorax sp. J2P1-31]
MTVASIPTPWARRSAEGARRRVLHALIGLVMAAGLPGAASAQAGLAPPVRFGILPLGGAFESRNDWEPVLADLSRVLGRPVSVLSVTSYEALEQAIQRNEVDMAFLSGRMALDAVTQRRMRVVAQVTRHDGLPGYRALLLTRKTGPLRTLDALLAEPERWRLARGESRSVSGFIVPQLQLFLPHHIAMETRFASELVGTHQATALAVANGEADVATNNTADFERFRLQFPVEAARLQVVWTSDLIPHAQIVVRRDYPEALQRQVQNFLVGYARAKGARGDIERGKLRALHDLAGFLAADNDSLLPAARLAYQLARQNAMAAQWVNEEARQARLQRIESSYAEQLAVLRELGP